MQSVSPHSGDSVLHTTMVVTAGIALGGVRARVLLSPQKNRRCEAGTTTVPPRTRRGYGVGDGPAHCPTRHASTSTQ